MKRSLYLLLITVFLFTTCRKADVRPAEACTASDFSAHPKATVYGDLIKKYTGKGLPGIALLIRDSSGTWAGSAGKADIEKNIAMQPCHISKVASITKIFMAVLAFKLSEEGKLDIDAKISAYLPDEIISRIENGDIVTVRHLLTHNSGVYDVISDNGFYLGVLNKPDRTWTQEELLEYVYDQPASFPPGEGPGYSNTNTLLLSMIIDNAGGKPHWELLREKIIGPLGLHDTYYYYRDRLPEGRVAQGYFDLYNNGNILNLSNYNTGSGNGYTGLYTTVFDMQVFIEALLVQQTLLNPASLAEMQDFNPVEETGKLLGAGLFKDFIHHPSGQYGLGHRGRDLAYSADLFYFPESGQVMSLIVNYGTDAESSLSPVFFDLRDEIVESMMEP